MGRQNAWEKRLQGIEVGGTRATFLIICLTPMLQFVSVTGFKEVEFKMQTTVEFTGQPSDYSDAKPAGEETVWKRNTHVVLSAQDFSSHPSHNSSYHSQYLRLRI